MLGSKHSSFYGTEIRLYDQDGSQWLQRGKPLFLPSWWEGNTDKVDYGRSIAMDSLLSNVSSNPSLRPTVAIIVGCPGCGAAFVTLCGTYGCKSDDSQALLAATEMEAAYFGYSVDMSRNGNKVAVSSFGNSEIPGSGYVRVWQMEETYELTPLGGTIVPNITITPSNATQIPTSPHILSIALAGDGNTLALVAGDRTGNMSVQVYAWSEGTWSMMGDPIYARFCLVPDHPYSDLVALSHYGDALAVVIGEMGVHVYDFQANNTEWIPRGNQTLDEVAGEDCQLFQSIALSSDGQVIAIGSFRTEDYAYLRVYQWTGSQWASAGARRKISQQATLSMTSSGTKVAVSVPVPPSSNDVTGKTSVYAIPNIQKCDPSETLLHLSLVATNTTTWEIRENSSKEILHEGGSYAGYDSLTVTEAVCLSGETCGLLSVRDTLGFYAYWGSNAQQQLSGYSAILNATIGSCTS